MKVITYLTIYIHCNLTIYQVGNECMIILVVVQKPLNPRVLQQLLM